MRVSRRLAIFVVLGGIACAGACTAQHKASPNPPPSSRRESTSIPSTTASPTTTATPTTTAPVLSGLVPASATFVSTQRAWVLKANEPACRSDVAPCRFRVIGTVDGGTTWTPLGTIDDAKDSGLRIRFADATHGFAFDRSQLFVTVDGGVHWALLHPPFTGVQDLAIARGIVYVVGFENEPALMNNFFVWSAPADHLVWSRDPLAIPLGAGPVPMQQLAFAGTNGYLVNNDRTVMGGARLTATGRWTNWEPPCGGDGSETIAVSSPTAVVGLCAIGVYTRPTVTHVVAFSNDGGATSHAHNAPTGGLLASPDPTTAVIALADTVWRTADAGTSWQSVYGPHEVAGASALELGFTTARQGYVILGDNRMLLTQDAGATWTPWGP